MFYYVSMYIVRWVDDNMYSGHNSCSLVLCMKYDSLLTGVMIIKINTFFSQSVDFNLT